MKRGSLKKSGRKKGQKFIGGWVDDRLVQLVEKAIVSSDTDKSKFLRNAIREKLARDHNHPVEALVN